MGARRRRVRASSAVRAHILASHCLVAVLSSGARCAAALGAIDDLTGVTERAVTRLGGAVLVAGANCARHAVAGGILAGGAVCADRGAG